MDVITPGALPAAPLDALRELTRCEHELEELRRDRVKAARASGASWKQVGEVLGMTERSAWEYFSRDIRAVVASTAEANRELGEDEAVELAVEEVRALRGHRGAG